MMFYWASALIGISLILSVSAMLHPFVKQTPQTDNDLENSAYNCNEAPGSFRKRGSCCQALYSRYNRLEECLNDPDTLEPDTSLFNCFTLMRNASQTVASAEEYTASSALPIVEYRFDADEHRLATIDAIACTMDGQGMGERWRPIIKRAYDLCAREYAAADETERRMYGGPDTCVSPSIHMLVCIDERMFVECPADDWARDDDAEECEAWREHVQRCPQNHMQSGGRIGGRPRGRMHKRRYGRRNQQAAQDE